MRAHASALVSMPTEPLLELSREALRDAIERSDGRRGAPEDEVRKLVGDACALAHSRGLHAEQLLILLKRTWRELPEARGLPHYEAEAALSSVISLCIEEFYTQRREGQLP